MHSTIEQLKQFVGEIACVNDDIHLRPAMPDVHCVFVVARLTDELIDAPAVRHATSGGGVDANDRA